MSELGRAVAAKLKAYELDEVEEVLREARISTAATVPKPVRLRVEQVAFHGIKRLRVPTQKDTATDAAASGGEEVKADADDAGLSGASARVEAAPSETVFREVPFNFSWKLGAGLYGVGSAQNLRGKSSLLEIIRWALRGRCRLQSDVALWLRHVTVMFLVNDEHIVVDFDVLDGVPRGSVTSQGGGSERARAVAQFSDHDSFEQVMDAVMMPLLQLQRIASWQDDKAIEHAWVTYAGALTVSSRGLDQLMGDIAFSGLPSRLLS
ncbi:MAG: hypothetical protein QG597_4659, partial [Actinomycetota bacterium]|nr:hypothetical protein [Actinomycetota bacterium]